MKILITGGGCREAIDGVRFVTNMSTGRTAAFLADALSAQGAEVAAVMGAGAVLPQSEAVRLVRYESGAELAAAVQAELEAAREQGKPYTAVIHAAAVSDFIPDTVTVGGDTYTAGKALKKLHSGGSMTVTFRAAPKIADRLREWAGDGAVIFCFKLTNGASAEERTEAVEKLAAHSAADYVVRNDLSEICAEKHPFAVIARDGTTSASGETLSDMAQAIAQLCARAKVAV